MSLHVNGSDAFKALALRTLQCLDARLELLAPDNERVNYNPTEQTTQRRLKTQQLLRELMTSGYRISIVETSGQSACVPTYRHANKSGSTVEWNSRQVLSFAPACPCIYLGHELCHAHQLIRGAVSPADFWGTIDRKHRYEWLNISGSYRGVALSGEERARTVTENDLRDEHEPPLQHRTQL